MVTLAKCVWSKSYAILCKLKHVPFYLTREGREDAVIISRNACDSGVKRLPKVLTAWLISGCDWQNNIFSPADAFDTGLQNFRKKKTFGIIYGFVVCSILALILKQFLLLFRNEKTPHATSIKGDFHSDQKGACLTARMGNFLLLRSSLETNLFSW